MVCVKVSLLESYRPTRGELNSYIAEHHDELEPNYMNTLNELAYDALMEAHKSKSNAQISGNRGGNKSQQQRSDNFVLDAPNAQQMVDLWSLDDEDDYKGNRN